MKNKMKCIGYVRINPLAYVARKKLKQKEQAMKKELDNYLTEYRKNTFNI